MDIVAAATGLSHAINIAKAVRDAEKSLDNATLRARMAEVMDKATDAKFALSEARDSIAEKDGEIARLKAAFEQRAELAIGEGDYKFRVNDLGHKLGYPFCPKCEAVDGRVVQLKQNGNWLAVKCPVCSSDFIPVACYVAAESGDGTETLEAQSDRRAKAARDRDEGLMRRTSPGRV